MKTAGIGAMGFGMLLGMSAGRENGLSLGENLLCGVIAGGYFSIIAVPAGALIGFMRGQVVKGNAVEYVIGNGEWKIVRQ